MEVIVTLLVQDARNIVPKMDYSNQRLKKMKLSSQGSGSGDSDQLSETLLVLVFESMKWDIHALCHLASSSRRLHAIAKRLLWRELCSRRAPCLMAALAATDRPDSRISGGWQALAKLLFFCPGCESTQYFSMTRLVPGHFVKESRFSKTSGRSFLIKKCHGDLLYVTDPCEHARGSDDDDLGVYRGVFREFIKSRTRACLVARQVALEERVRCAYCGARVWSMTRARLVPKSAAKRLGSHGDKVEFFVCVNGHLFGSCWLIPLSSDEGETDGDDDCENDEFRYDDPTAMNGGANNIRNGQVP